MGLFLFQNKNHFTVSCAHRNWFWSCNGLERLRIYIAMLVTCGSGGDGPEVVAWMFGSSSNFLSSPLCPDGVQVLDFGVSIADDLLS